MEARRADEHLWHTSKDGVAKDNCYLEDYTHLMKVAGAISDHIQPTWYVVAGGAAELMIESCSIPIGPFDTSKDHEKLIGRLQELQNNAKI